MPSSKRNRANRRSSVSLTELLCVCALVFGLVGCGKSLQVAGTEQLLASDSIDSSIARIDFSPLEGQKVYFDTQYIKTIKGIGFVNADYIISALRQQILAHGCMLQEKVEDADYIVEARVGALGGDQHDVIYGVPENNAVSSVASVLPNAPPIPTIPEISVARKSHHSATAKVSAFAYERESRERVWQSGTSVARSKARDMWLFGVGPFQSGTVYQGTHLAGEKIRAPWKKPLDRKQTDYAYHMEKLFNKPAISVADQSEKSAKEGAIQPASHEVPAAGSSTTRLEGTSPENAKPAEIERAVSETVKSEPAGEVKVELQPPE